MVCTNGMFPVADRRLRSKEGKTNKVGLVSEGSFVNIPFSVFVLRPAVSRVSNTTRAFSLAFAESRANNAPILIFLFIFFVKTRSLVGPPVTPPPFHKGDRMLPWRARPVCFCAHGFFPPPLTSPRPFVLALTTLLFDCWETTT